MELLEQIAYGRYLAWFMVFGWVVIRRSWFEHALVLAAMGYEDIPKLYNALEVCLLRVTIS